MVVRTADNEDIASLKHSSGVNCVELIGVGKATTMIAGTFNGLIYSHHIGNMPWRPGGKRR